MGFNEVREVRTTYTCDFCKHSEVVVSEYGHNTLLPQGWSAMVVVPAADNPYSGIMSEPSYSPSTRTRYCLTSDKQMNVVIACPACSVYGLQIIKRKQLETEQPKSNKSMRSFYAIMWALSSACAILGFAAGFLLKR